MSEAHPSSSASDPAPEPGHPAAPADPQPGVEPLAAEPPVEPPVEPVTIPAVSSSDARRPRWAEEPVTNGTPSHWLEPEPVAAASLTPPARGGILGQLFAVALVASIISSAGTFLILDASGTLDRDAPAAPAGPVGQTTGTTSVTISEDSAVIRATAAVSPAVVTITTRKGDGTTGNPLDLPATGKAAGIIFDSKGWILTNRHVVEGAQTITVKLMDGREFQANLYGIDTLTDLAIVKVDARDLPVAPMGDSTALKAGQLAIAIGDPLGTFENSVTVGVISALGREISVPDAQTGQPRQLRNLIQHDAAINEGNSGGALVDSLGQVIGVNTALAGGSTGIGFAIPIEIAKPIMRQALAGETLSRPYLGIVYTAVTPTVMRKASLPIDYGAWVSGANDGRPPVVVGSPAEKAGIKDGDIITAIGGQRIDAGHSLEDVLVRYSPGDEVTLSVLRAGATLELKVTLGTRPSGLE